MSVLSRRIMGTETEYGITYMDGGRRRLAPDDIARYLFRPIAHKYGSSNVFIPNASRLYLDVGSHPEIATAECDSILQLMAAEKAGDRIVDDLALQAEAALAADNLPGEVFVFKNNVDSFGNSYGSHENYLMSRATVVKNLNATLVPFLVTRQLIAGAGKISRPIPGTATENYGVGFCLSQRADHMWEGVSSATTRSRPIINTRDEPHADSHLYRRLHVIVGDSTMSEPTFALKIGATLLVLELIEAKIPLPDMELDHEVTSIRDIARDTTGTHLVKLRNGSTMSAGEIQCAYLDAARTWIQQRPIGTAAEDHRQHEVLQQVVRLWERVLDAIETQDFSPVSKDIDWIIKKKLLDRYQEKYGYDLDHPKLAQLDLLFHDLRPQRSVFYALQRRGLVRRWITDEDIINAQHTAPQTTRARLRGEFLNAAAQYNAPVSVDWTRFKVNRPEPQVVEILDPFADVDARVDELIAYMAEHAE